MKKLLCLSAACFVTSLFAAVPQPANCPKDAIISKQGVNKVVIKVDNSWIAGRSNMTYNTKEHWSFVITNIRAKDSKDAYKKAKTALKNLTFQSGPLQGPAGKWVCVYNTKKGYPAVALTPPLALTEAVPYAQ